MMKSSEAKSAAAKRIAQLESEIETRRAEILHLKRESLPGCANAHDSEEDDGDEANQLGSKSQSSRVPLKDLLNSWERRFAKSRIARRTTPPNKVAPDSSNAPPATVCTISLESDGKIILESDIPSESTKGSVSGGSIDVHLRERETLQAIICSDTKIIEGLMAAIEGLAKNEGGTRAVSFEDIAELKDALSVRNEALYDSNGAIDVLPLEVPLYTIAEESEGDGSSVRPRSKSSASAEIRKLASSLNSRKQPPYDFVAAGSREAPYDFVARHVSTYGAGDRLSWGDILRRRDKARRGKYDANDNDNDHDNKKQNAKDTPKFHPPEFIEFVPEDYRFEDCGVDGRRTMEDSNSGATELTLATSMLPLAEASEPKNASIDEPDEALEARCARLEDAIEHLQAANSDQENVIEFLKTEVVKLLATNKIIERKTSAELEQRAVASQSRIATLEACSSSLENAIETLQAENLRLRVRSRNLEEENSRIEDEMETIKNGLQTFYTEKLRYDIL